MWQTSHTLKGSTISQQCSLPLSRFYHAFRNWLGWNRATSCRDSCTKVTCWRKVWVHDTRQTRQVTLSVCPFYSFIRDSFIAGAARVWSKLVCKICNEIKLHRARRLPKKHTHTQHSGCCDFGHICSSPNPFLNLVGLLVYTRNCGVRANEFYVRKFFEAIDQGYLVRLESSLTFEFSNSARHTSTFVMQ